MIAFTLLFWNAFNDPGVLVVFGTLDFLLLYLMVAFAVFWGVEVGGEKLPIAFLQEPLEVVLTFAMECLGQYKPLLPKYQSDIYSKSPISLPSFLDIPRQSLWWSHRFAFQILYTSGNWEMSLQLALDLYLPLLLCEP